MVSKFNMLRWMMQVSKVILKDGRTLDSTLVVVGIGAKPLLAPFKGLLEEEKGGFKVCAKTPHLIWYCNLVGSTKLDIASLKMRIESTQSHFLRCRWMLHLRLVPRMCTLLVISQHSP